MKRRIRFNLTELHFGPTVTRAPRRRNRAGLALLGLLLVSGCDSFDISDPIESLNRGALGRDRASKQWTYGVIAGDEASSVSIGHSMLLNGGSAADAASAMMLALSSTRPARGSLGGGGVCLVGGGRAGQVQVLEFLPTPGTNLGPHVDRPSAVPAMLRGVAALHVKHGRLDWGAIVAPALEFARDGILTDNGFVQDLSKFADPLFADPASRAVFSQRNGKPFGLGQRMRQIDLSTVLALVQGRGAGELYAGRLAGRLADAIMAAGGSVGSEDLRRFLPQWRDPVSVQIGDSVLYTPPPPASAGIVAVQILQSALATPSGGTETSLDKAHVLAEAAKRSLADRSNWLGTDFGASARADQLLSVARAKERMRGFSAARASSSGPDATKVTPEFDAGTSFTVVDGEGLTVACTLTMYHLFGTGRTAPGLGILLAPAPDEKGRNPLPLGPVVITRASDNASRFAFAASGGAASATAMANVMYRALLLKEPLKPALAGARIHYALARDEIVIEDREMKDRLVGLIAKGHKIKRLPKIGRVNAFACPSGLPASLPDCEAASDPRGEGIDATVYFRKDGS